MEKNLSAKVTELKRLLTLRDNTAQKAALHGRYVDMPNVYEDYSDEMDVDDLALWQPLGRL